MIRKLFETDVYATSLLFLKFQEIFIARKTRFLNWFVSSSRHGLRAQITAHFCQINAFVSEKVGKMV